MEKIQLINPSLDLIDEVNYVDLDNYLIDNNLSSIKHSHSKTYTVFCKSFESYLLRIEQQKSVYKLKLYFGDEISFINEVVSSISQEGVMAYLETTARKIHRHGGLGSEKTYSKLLSDKINKVNNAVFCLPPGYYGDSFLAGIVAKPNV